MKYYTIQRNTWTETEPENAHGKRKIILYDDGLNPYGIGIY